MKLYGWKTGANRGPLLSHYFVSLHLFVQVITIYVSVLHDKTALDACNCSWCGLSHTFFTKQATTKTINHSKFWYKCMDMMRLIDQPSR